jgi:hypothetical protein
MKYESSVTAVSPIGAWDRVFRVFFALVPTSAVRAMRKAVQIGPIEELVIAGRRSGHDRPVLVVLARVGSFWYVGHPNGDSADWVLNLIAAGRAKVITRAGPTTVRAVLLEPGGERNIAIREHTSQQKALPTRLLYRAARAHVTSAGAFFRLEPERADADFNAPSRPRTLVGDKLDAPETTGSS